MSNLLAERVGLKFESHRLHILDRAVRQRMKARGTESFRDYFARVSAENGEFGLLVDLATNSLSRFCRNSGQLLALSGFIGPELARSLRGSPGQLKIWVAGCATGEEPYSVAMVLADSLADGFHITATDVSRSALNIASAGVYTTKQTKDIPETMRTKHLSRVATGWRVKDTIRSRIDFLEHNVAAGPAIRGADLVLCRNVLIYLTDEARSRAVESIAAALAEDGYLLVGNSETLAGDRRFTSLATEWGRVYRRSCPAGGRSLP
jgi:two-component system CheB/CheR fusion protein